MIGNVGPCQSCCEHTLNTLRYADRVKELKKENLEENENLKIKNSKNLSVEKGNIIAIADIKANEFVDHQQQLKVPLSSVSFDRSFQAFSSSFAIRARWLGGSLVVLRSSPFSGGSGGLVDALKAKGLMK
jgi:hypothetical protein